MHMSIIVLSFSSVTLESEIEKESLRPLGISSAQPLRHSALCFETSLVTGKFITELTGSIRNNSLN